MTALRQTLLIRIGWGFLSLCVPARERREGIFDDLLDDTVLRFPHPTRLAARLWLIKQILSVCGHYTLFHLRQWPHRRVRTAIVHPRKKGTSMEGLTRDLRETTRRFTKRPVTMAIAVTTLAIGIGANTAMFSIVDAAMLRPLPYPEADRLVSILNGRRAPGESVAQTHIWWSYPKYEVIAREATTFESLAAYANSPTNLTGIQQPRRLETELTSQAYFPILGVNAIIGRTFLPEEDRTPETHPVALLGYSLWQSQYGADAGIVGQTIEVNEVPLTVVGILPRGFRGLTGTAELWVPMMMAPTLMRNSDALTWWGTHWHRIVAKLPSTEAQSAVETQLSTLGSELDNAFPSPGGAETVLSAVPLDQSRLDPGSRRSMMVLLGAVIFVLLIACINVGALMMGQASDRRQELSIRLAMGASRLRIARQLLTESVLVALMGGAAGIALAYLGLSAMSAVMPSFDTSFLFQTADIYISSRVLLFTLAVSVASGILFGCLPALTISRSDVASSMNATSRGGVNETHRARLVSRGALIAAQFALAMLLLSGAGLMLRSFASLRAVDAGFDPESVLTARLQPTVGEPRTENLIAFKQDLLERVASLPGVTDVSVSNCTPLSGRCWRTIVTQTQDQQFSRADAPEIGVEYVGPGHFRTLGISVLRGRSFSPQDNGEGPPVLIINEAAARQLWPGEDALGKRMRIGEPMFSDGTFGEVVGIVADVRYGSPSEEARPHAYLSVFQGGPSGLLIMIRSQRTEASLVPDVRQVVLSIDQNLPLFEVMTMTDRVVAASADSRFGTILLGVFAGMALILAAIGLYGSMAYQVSRHTREIGLRIALGARETRVMRWMLRRGFVTALVGISIGLIASLFAMRLMTRLLYDVSPGDPVTLLVVGSLLLLVSLAATYLPARRAASVEPMSALRAD